MAEPIRTGDSNFAQRTNTYAAAVSMLKRAQLVIVTDKTATPVKMPRNKGDNITMRRYNAFSESTTPLVEGVTPSGHKVTATDYVATLKQYGDYVRFTDKVVDLHEDDVPAQITELNGEQVGRTIEKLNYGIIKAGTSVFYANGTQRTDVNTALTYAKQHKVIRFLRAQVANTFREVLSPSPNYATKGIEASYIALAHTDLEHDIRALANFVPTASYGSRQLIDDTEIGAVENVRYLLSPYLDPWTNAGGTPTGVLSTGGSAADVYPVIYFGKDAWHTVALRGKDAVTVTSQMPGVVSDTDPLGQRGFQGWKTYWAAKITNEAWMARLEVAVTAL